MHVLRTNIYKQNYRYQYHLKNSLESKMATQHVDTVEMNTYFTTTIGFGLWFIFIKFRKK